jgi:hypothetical protein
MDVETIRQRLADIENMFEKIRDHPKITQASRDGGVDAVMQWHLIQILSVAAKSSSKPKGTRTRSVSLQLGIYMER